MTKILYIFDASDWDSRMAVANLARDKGYNVIIGLINGDNKSSDFKIIPLKSSFNNIGILSSFKMIKDMNRIIRKENPDIIHVVTLKYSFMAGIAAFPFKNTRKIFTLAGLGYLFRSDDLKSKILRIGLRPFLTIILRRANTTLIFQNSDDLELMVKDKYTSAKYSVLIKGSGVYLDKFIPKHSDNNHTPIVLMPTRLVHEKGISVFIKAAKILEKCGVQAKFQIAGGETKHNPRAISKLEMQEMLKDSHVQWLGRVDNMPDLLSKATLIVYPSYYGEGIPRVLLESCASGRAIVTTDHAGCREAVEHGVNGLLVPVKDANKTAMAIKELLLDGHKRNSMEIQSRIRAEKEFDIHIIAHKTLDTYKASMLNIAKITD